MHINRANFRSLEAELSRPSCQIEFVVDKHTIEITREIVPPSDRHFLVYIDGLIELGWGHPSSARYWPFVEHFWRKRSRYCYSPIKQKEIIKQFGYKDALLRFPNLEKKSEWYEPNFSDAQTLIAQLSKLPPFQWHSRQPRMFVA